MNSKELNEKKKKYYKENPDRYRKHLDTCKRGYYKNRDKDIIDGYVWRMKNKDKLRQTVKMRKIKNPLLELRRRMREKENHKKEIEARNITNNSGIKKSEFCDICSSKQKLNFHHWRYDKPLLVNTLCTDCHRIQHIKNFDRWHKARLIYDKQMEVTA